MINVADLAAERAAAHSGRPALIHNGAILSFGDLVERADAIAARLKALGVIAHTRVALFCPNGPDYVVLAFGILRAGGCLVPVASELAIPERISQLTLTAPKLMIAAGDQPWLPTEGNSEEAGGVRFTWCECSDSPEFPEDRLAAFSPAFIRFSSGTTGTSKGVVLGHETLLARVQSANRRLRLTGEDRVLWTLPMAHHFAVTIMLYLLEGVTIVLEDSHLAEDVLGTAIASNATVIYGSPFHLALLAAEDSGRAWPSLRMAVGTAAAVSAGVVSAFHKRYGVAPSQGMGIIEAGLPLLNTDAQTEKPTSVGKPDDIAVRLRDEQGNDVPPGEIGELWLRGPGIFDAYLHPWCERADVTDDGWFATGDLASQDADGHVFLRGRRKTVINFGGMKFFPEEVEAVLNTHPDVLESLVSGEAHERWGAVAVADIIPRNPAMPPKPVSLAKFCRDRLASYKVPVRFRVVAELLKTASGKLKR